MVFSGDDELLVWLSSEVVTVFPHLLSVLRSWGGVPPCLSVSVVNRMVINDHA